MSDVEDTFSLESTNGTTSTSKTTPNNNKNKIDSETGTTSLTGEMEKCIIHENLQDLTSISNSSNTTTTSSSPMDGFNFGASVSSSSNTTPSTTSNQWTFSLGDSTTTATTTAAGTATSTATAASTGLFPSKGLFDATITSSITPSTSAKKATFDFTKSTVDTVASIPQAPTDTEAFSFGQSTTSSSTNSSNGDTINHYSNHLQHTFFTICYNHRKMASRSEWDKTNLPPLVIQDLMQRRTAYTKNVQLYLSQYVNDASEDTNGRLVSDPTAATAAATTTTATTVTPDKVRLQIKSPNAQVISAFRQHVKAGNFKPNALTGGACTILIELGDLPSSKDEIIHILEYNCWVTDVDRNNNGNAQTQNMLRTEKYIQHTRLMRYSEIIDSYVSTEQRRRQQQEQGQYDSFNLQDYTMKNKKELECEQSSQDRAIFDQQMKSEMNESEELHQELLPMIQVFTMGYYKYCVGEARFKELYRMDMNTLRNVYKDDIEGLNVMSRQVDFCVGLRFGDLIDQCTEIQELYKQKKSPLGNGRCTISLSMKNLKKQEGGTVKSSKKKNRKKGSSGKKSSTNLTSHAKIVEFHISSIFQVLATNIQRPSSKYTILIRRLVDTFEEAMAVDKDVSRAICQRDTVTNIIKIQEQVVKFAKDMDELSILHPLFAQCWWDLDDCLSNLLTRTIGIAIEKDTSKYASEALDVYRKKVHPYLISKIASNSAREMISGYSSFRNVASVFPVDITLGFLYREDLWGCIVKILTQDVQTHLDLSDHEKSREKKSYFRAAKKAIYFINCIVKQCINYEEGSAGSSKNRTLVRDLVNRGVIEMILCCAKKSEYSHSGIMINTFEATSDFAVHEIGRDKLWELKDDILLLLEKGFNSKTINVVSEAMYLVSHIQLDSKWCNPLVEMDPPIEKIGIRCVIFGMRSFCERAYEAQIAYIIAREKMIKKVNEYREIQKKQKKTRDELHFLCNFDRDKKELDSLSKWHKLEVRYEDTHSDDIQRAIARPLIALHFMPLHPGSLQRIKEGYCLAVAASHLDTYNGDIFGSAVYFLWNFFRDSSSPLFPSLNDVHDPSHFLKCLLHPMERSGWGSYDANMIHECCKSIMVKLLQSPSWRPCLVGYA